MALHTSEISIFLHANMPCLLILPQKKKVLLVEMKYQPQLVYIPKIL